MIRLLFKQSVLPAEFVAFAEANKWTLVDHWPAEPGQPEEFIWETGTGVDVHRVNDEILGLSYTALNGPPEAQESIRETKELITSRFSAYDPREVRDWYRAADSWDKKVFLIPMMAVTAPVAYDEETYQLLSSSLHDSHKDVRLAAVIASFYLPWAELIPDLTELTTDREPEEVIRQGAENAIGSIKEQQRSGDANPRP
ncbi:hypothetical protein ABGB16_06445 [Micromonospora sp. B11E3]|uniref:HEAT repeat domain-containing protein n=1 Tax=Micromonospora sp. B11E3 TaxID=3153562 RepID=UPI00325F5227